jgi:hypothetical protein
MAVAARRLGLLFNSFGVFKQEETEKTEGKRGKQRFFPAIPLLILLPPVQITFQ